MLNSRAVPLAAGSTRFSRFLVAAMQHLGTGERTERASSPTLLANGQGLCSWEGAMHATLPPPDPAQASITQHRPRVGISEVLPPVAPCRPPPQAARRPSTSSAVHPGLPQPALLRPRRKRRARCRLPPSAQRWMPAQTCSSPGCRTGGSRRRGARPAAPSLMPPAGGSSSGSARWPRC